MAVLAKIPSVAANPTAGLAMVFPLICVEERHVKPSISFFPPVARPP